MQWLDCCCCCWHWFAPVLASVVGEPLVEMGADEDIDTLGDELLDGGQAIVAPGPICFGDVRCASGCWLVVAPLVDAPAPEVADVDEEPAEGA